MIRSVQVEDAGSNSRFVSPSIGMIPTLEKVAAQIENSTICQIRIILLCL